MSKLAGAFESTAVFLFFLVIFMVGAMMAMRQIGAYVRPTSASMGAAMQAA